MNDIYQQIWNSDHHKLLVSPRNCDGNWCNPEADILLDEQLQASGRKDLDLAKKPLFYHVNDTKLNSIPTFVSCIKLLDNYKFDNQQAEIITRAEKAEVAQFITDICQTKPMEIARAYIKNRLDFQFDSTRFRQQVKSIWFDLYTNYFGDQAIKDASGFEHIFVGEGKYDYLSAVNQISGAISGYHSWLKFYLDEQANRVNYLGHNYDLQGDIGVDNPYIATVQMLWQTQDPKKKLPVKLFKKKGCFFIGTSPECEVAMGTVAYFESLANHQFKDEKRKITINGSAYYLALYRNTKLDGSRGNYLRSFYPIFLGKETNA